MIAIIIISYYLQDSIGVRKEYLYHPWQDVTKQYVGIRKKFNSFGDFGESTLAEMFSDGMLDDATVLSLNYMKTAWVENLGNNNFKMHALPISAQLGPVYGILPQHLNDDNRIDLLLVGNDFGMEVQQGPADALVGVSLQNNGNGEFETIALEDSQFFVPGDGKSLINLNIANNRNLIVASQNNDSLKIFEPIRNSDGQIIKLKAKEVKAEIFYNTGKKRIQEFYWGSSFQSQSSRYITLRTTVKEVIFFDDFGKETRRILSPQAHGIGNSENATKR